MYNQISQLIETKNPIDIKACCFLLDSVSEKIWVRNVIELNDGLKMEVT